MGHAPVALDTLFICGMQQPREHDRALMDGFIGELIFTSLRFRRQKSALTKSRCLFLFRPFRCRCRGRRALGAGATAVGAATTVAPAPSPAAPGLSRFC